MAARGPIASTSAIALAISLAALLPSPAAGAPVGATVKADDANATIRGGVLGSDMELAVVPDAENRLVLVRDTAGLNAGRGCEPVTAIAVRCSLSQPEITINVDLGGGDDTLAAFGDGSRTTLDAQLGEGTDSGTLEQDAAFCGGYPCRLSGGGDDDTLVGGNTTGYFLAGGPGDDLLTANGSSVFEGGPGDDTENGSPGTDSFGTPDPGDDVVYGNGGTDHVHEQAGADLLHGGSGADWIYTDLGKGRESADLIDGDAGVDGYVRYCGSCEITLDTIANDGRRGADEGDQIDVEMLDIENTVSNENRKPLGTGSDRLVGNERPNTIFASRGGDVVVGRDGADELYSNSGNDIIRAVDGQRDRVIDCGGGIDRAFIDRLDKAAESCERVVVRP